MATLLDEVIDAHGGRRRFRKASEISVSVRSGGLLMRSKLQGKQFSDYALSVSTDRQSAVFRPYPRAGQTGVFDQGTVRVLDPDGKVIAEREHARDAFSGVSGLRRRLWWDDLDALYFAGYAMSNYLTIPFVLESDGFEVQEGEPMEVGGEQWRRLEVRFPEGFHTHCRDQVFYFDSGGLLRRHDYGPEVVASFARGCHFSSEHRRAGGLVFPTKRRVVPQAPGGRPLPGPTIVSIELASISVT